MVGDSRTARFATGALAVAGVVAVSASQAQEAGRPLLTFSLSQSLEASDNPNFIEDPTGTSLTARTGLGFSFASSTQSQSFSLDAGASLLYELANSSDDPFDNGLDGPFVRLSYGREAANARFNLGANFSRNDVGDLRTVTDPSGNDLVVDDGQVDRTGFTLGIATGLEAPFGFSLDTSLSRREYTDTTNPDLVDDETTSARAQLRFGLNRVTDLSLVASYGRDRELEGGDFDRRSTAVGLQFDRELSPVQRVSIEVTSDQIETTDTGTTTENDGISASARFVQDLQNGTFSFSGSSVVESTGTRNSLRHDRSILFPTGAFEYYLGVTNADTSDLNPIFGATFTRAVSTASISISVSQEISQDTSSDDELRNRAVSVSYSQSINNVSGWSGSLGLSETDNLTDDTDVRRTNASLSYNRDLTRDWDIVAGYRYANSRSSTDPSRSSNTLFLTVQRDFAVRP